MATSEILVTVGTTPATPASGKSKIFVNSSKQLSTVDDTGLVTSVVPGANAVSQATPANPTGTTDTTGKMMGLAGAITPLTTGRVLIIISGDIANSTATDGAKVQMRWGTGSAPANAAAPTGTIAGGFVTFTKALAAEQVPFSLNAIVTGLTLSTAIWIDVALAAITGGTATIADVSISAVEI